MDKPKSAVHLAYWHRWVALIRNERLVSHNLIVVLGTFAAGLLGVAFQSAVSHQLRPADYGAVFAVVTLLTFVALPASGFTLLMARETSRDIASGHFVGSTALLRRGNRGLLFVGIVIAFLLIVFAPFVHQFLGVPIELLIAASASIPFTLALPLLLGELQGQQRFLALAVLSTSQAAMKLVGAVAVGRILGPFGIVVGISLAAAAAYLVALRVVRRKLNIRVQAPWVRSAAGYLAVVLPSTIALAALLSTDVLLAKHFFSPQVAGEYGAVAALGRAIFWGATGIAAVLFPKAVFRRASGGTGSPILIVSLVLVALGGLSGLIALVLGSHWLLVAFAGQAYQAAARYLPLYTVGMILLGASAVLIASHQTRGKADFLAILLPLTAVEPLLIYIFHQDVWQVIEVVDISMALIAVSLGALYVMREPASAHPQRTVATTTSAATSAAGIH